MCGHVGIAGKLEHRDENLMKRLLVFDYFRGPDSTGIAVIDKQMALRGIVKVASHPIDLFDMARFKAALSGHGSSAFIGHNRAMTKGAVTAVNAHPYEFGHIIGCHNGTLSYASHNALEQAVGEKFDVDSQAIFACIEKLGIEGTVPLLQGAWALVWVDLKEGTLNFLRNKERPFWYGYDKDQTKLMWASEYQIMRAACETPVPYEVFKSEQGYSYWMLPEDVHYAYDLAKMATGKIDKPMTKTRKGKEPAPVQTYAAGVANPFPQTHTTGTGSTTKSHGHSAGGTGDVLVLFPTPDDPFKGHITEAEFESIAKYGCSWCGADVAFDDDGITVFQKSGVVLCSDCSNHNNKGSRLYVNQ